MVYAENLPALEQQCGDFFCIQEELKLSKPGGICAVNAALQKPWHLKVKDHTSIPQFLPIFHYLAALKRIVVSYRLVSVIPWPNGWLKWLSSQAASSVPHFAVFIGTNGLFTRTRLLLNSCHDNKLFYLQIWKTSLLSLFQTPCLYCHEFMRNLQLSWACKCWWVYTLCAHRLP